MRGRRSLDDLIPRDRLVIGIFPTVRPTTQCRVLVEMSDKLPFQVVERRAKPFIESVIPVNVERLQKHRENLQAVSEVTRNYCLPDGALLYYTLFAWLLVTVGVGPSSTAVCPIACV